MDLFRDQASANIQLENEILRAQLEEHKKFVGGFMKLGELFVRCVGAEVTGCVQLLEYLRRRVSGKFVLCLAFTSQCA